MSRKNTQYTNSFLQAKGTLKQQALSRVPSLKSAIEFLQQGQLNQADASCKLILKQEPRNTDALHLLGLIAYLSGNQQAAIDMFNEAIEINPNIATYYSSKGNAMQKINKFETAVANYNNAIALKPEFAEAYFNRGNAQKKLNQLDAALASYDKSISLKSNFTIGYLNRGVLLKELNKLISAIESFDEAIRLNPGYAEAYYNRGNTLQDLNKLNAAVKDYDKAIALKPEYPEAYFNRGNALKKIKQLDSALASYNKAINLKLDFHEAYLNKGVVLVELHRLDEAVESYDKAIDLNFDSAEAYYNRGIVLRQLKQLDKAIVDFNTSITLRPNYAEPYLNRGVVLLKLNQLDEAIVSFDNAIALKPDYAEAYCNRGVVFHAMRQINAAIADYEKAIALKSDYADAYYNLGNAMKEIKQFEIAVATFDRAIALKPGYDYLSGIMQHVKMWLCEWEDYSHNILELSLKIQNNEKASPSFSALALPLTLSEHRQAAEIWSNDKYPFDPSLGPIVKYVRHPKIRIGYYSADFHLHPVSILTVGLFEHHDKNKFEIIAFSYSPYTQDIMRKRISNSFDKFIDVQAKSDKEVALISRALEIDIAIDLSGHTQGGRTGIFAFRAAPIQLSYIGYLGTMGAQYYDYLVADKIIIPTNLQTYYTEKIVYLPSYQVNDNKQEIPNTTFSRQELNLPSNGFIFCCFNANYKITPSTFDGWMRILKAVPDSVLLLNIENERAIENLKQETEKRGITQNRLIFCGMLDRNQHLSRCRSSDLFLDTSPYNAGATASDALWAGLPVLTCMGQSFASRVAASLLNAMGIPEMVTETQKDYEELAVELATNPVKLNAIKDKLERNRLTTPLFDTPQFTKHLEAAYTKMYEKYQADLAADHIYI